MSARVVRKCVCCLYYKMHHVVGCLECTNGSFGTREEDNNNNNSSHNDTMMSSRELLLLSFLWLSLPRAVAARCFLLHFVKISPRMSEGNFVSYKKLSIDGQLIRLIFASVSKEEAHLSVVWALTKKSKHKKNPIFISIIWSKLQRNFVYVFFPFHCGECVFIVCVFVSDINRESEDW